MNVSAPVPALAHRIGGALVTVLSDIDAYTDTKHPLDSKQQLAVARIVQDYPSLNTEENVAMLVDVVAYYSVTAMNELRRYLAQYGCLLTYLAVSYLHEAAEMNRAHTAPKLDLFNYERDRLAAHPVRHTTALLATLDLASQYRVIETPEDVAHLVDDLGGLDALLALDEAELTDALETQRHNQGEEHYEYGQ